MSGDREDMKTTFTVRVYFILWWACIPGGIDARLTRQPHVECLWRRLGSPVGSFTVEVPTPHMGRNVHTNPEEVVAFGKNPKNKIFLIETQNFTYYITRTLYPLFFLEDRKRGLIMQHENPVFPSIDKTRGCIFHTVETKNRKIHKKKNIDEGVTTGTLHQLN